MISRRVDVDADQLQVGIDPPAHLRLVQAGADRQHDIGLAPQLMAGERRLGEIMAVADDALAAGVADHRRLQHLGDRQHLLGRRDSAAADKEQRLLGAGEQGRRFVDQLRDRASSVAGGSPAAGSVDLGLERHDVERHFERDRARAAVAQLPERLVDESAGLGRMVDARRPFGEGLQDRRAGRESRAADRSRARSGRRGSGR